MARGPMPITASVIRSEGAALASVPRAAAGTNHGSPIPAPTAMERRSTSRRVNFSIALGMVRLPFPKPPGKAPLAPVSGRDERCWHREFLLLWSERERDGSPRDPKSADAASCPIEGPVGCRSHWRLEVAVDPSALENEGRGVGRQDLLQVLALAVRPNHHSGSKARSSSSGRSPDSAKQRSCAATR